MAFPANSPNSNSENPLWKQRYSSKFSEFKLGESSLEPWLFQQILQVQTRRILSGSIAFPANSPSLDSENFSNKFSEVKIGESILGIIVFLRKSRNLNYISVCFYKGSLKMFNSICSTSLVLKHHYKNLYLKR